MPPHPLQLPDRDFALARSVDEFVAALQHEYQWRLPSEPKLIRDAVHGYQLLANHEIPVVDSPLVQRLRGIHQTTLAYYVYPSATHTRFDHSLGVAKMVQAMIEALRATESPGTIPDAVLQRVRLAALLHDCGHMIFSHLGESVAAEMFPDEITEAKQRAAGLFQGKSLGEMLSFLMVTSPTFAQPLDAMLQEAGLTDVNTGRIALLILGKSADPAQQFEGDMISGPFDADKLDYLLRDCHFSGIRTTVDIERVYYTVRLLQAPSEPRSLAMHISGVPNLEQILFAKMMLYTSVYHHQKVRALECCFRGIIERIRDAKGTLTHDALELDTLLSWLNLTEETLFVLGKDEPALRESVARLANRQLLKRALVISIDTVKKSSQDGLIEVYSDADRADEWKDLRREIHAEMGSKVRGELADLWLDVPEPPTVIRDVLQVKITADRRSHRPLSTDRFQWDRWTNNYGEVKWRAHIFTRDNDRARVSAARASARVLRRRYNLRLNGDARQLAKN